MPKPTPKTSKEQDANTLRMPAEPGSDQATLYVEAALSPTVRAAVTTQAYSKPVFGPMDLTTLTNELAKQVDIVHGGDLKRAEAMLISQAHTLDTIFHELAGRAGLNMGVYLEAAETYMRLALKAQSQCRSTLEALAEIKNPRPVAFVKQANIAHGPQQVNNGAAAPPAEPSRAGESENPPSKLLEHTDGERLDFGTTAAASGAHSALEAVGAIDRAKEPRR